jgi:nitroimidazol reductase NimA-like FMN-containing flavoprotein (pyridoxamine 5'-phosphate oxidase superfamily)
MVPIPAGGRKANAFGGGWTMFRELRRKDKLLSNDDAWEILERNSFGVLAVSGDEGYPYAVPLNYVWVNGSIFIHCAKVGHKIDAIKINEKVSFSVVDGEEVSPEKFKTYYKSVIAFGKARLLSDDPALTDTKQAALEAIVVKFSPDYIEKGNVEIKAAWNRVEVIEIKVEYLSAKGSHR